MGLKNAACIFANSSNLTKLLFGQVWLNKRSSFYKALFAFLVSRWTQCSRTAGWFLLGAMSWFCSQQQRSEWTGLFYGIHFCLRLIATDPIHRKVFSAYLVLFGACLYSEQRLMLLRSLVFVQFSYHLSPHWGNALVAAMAHLTAGAHRGQRTT